MRDFGRLHERIRKRRLARYEYGRRRVPAPALAVVLESGKRWWWVTPAMAQDGGAWRYSYGDERGPAGHQTASLHGGHFWTKYDAILDILSDYPKARITKYILPGGRHVEVSKVRPNPGRPEYRVRRRRNR